MSANEPKSTETEAKKKRLAAALRANMKRRKEQSRGRENPQDEPKKGLMSDKSDGGG